MTIGFTLAPHCLACHGLSTLHQFAVSDVVDKERRQSVARKRSGSILQMIMKMRLGGVAAVAAFSQQVADLDTIVATHAQAAVFEVREK
jgi:hypothetical protein